MAKPVEVKALANFRIWLRYDDGTAGVSATALGGRKAGKEVALMAPKLPALESRHIRRTLLAQTAGAGSLPCPVTQPNGRTYMADPPGGNHGNDALVTGLWPDGNVIFKPVVLGSYDSEGAGVGCERWP